MEQTAVSLWDAITFLAPLIGTGGITAILVAWLGRRAQAAQPPDPPSSPVQIESPWLVQNLLEVKLLVERGHEETAALVKSVSELAVQVNTIGALLRRRNRDAG